MLELRPTQLSKTEPGTGDRSSLSHRRKMDCLAVPRPIPSPPPTPGSAEQARRRALVGDEAGEPAALQRGGDGADFCLAHADADRWGGGPGVPA